MSFTVLPAGALNTSPIRPRLRRDFICAELAPEESRMSNDQSSAVGRVMGLSPGPGPPNVLPKEWKNGIQLVARAGCATQHWALRTQKL